MDIISNDLNRQHREPLDEEVVMELAGDPLVVKVLRELNWLTLDLDGLESKVPGCGDAVESLIGFGVLTRQGDEVRISEPYQAFGSEIDHDDGIWLMLSADKEGWIHEMGFLSSYIVESLISILFDIEPVWEGESLKLATRAGLVDGDGTLTVRGRRMAFSLFATVSEVFDRNRVVPEELFDRWSS